MFPKSLLVLAAVSSCCYAQQTASDLTTAIDSISQSLTDLTALVKAVASYEQAQTATNKYYDIVSAESKFNNDNSQASPTAFADAEQEKLCSSLKTSISEHISLLDAFSPQFNAFFAGSQSPIVAALLKNDEGNTDVMLLQVGEMAPTCKDAALENKVILADKFSEVTEQYGKTVPEVSRRA